MSKRKFINERLYSIETLNNSENLHEIGMMRAATRAAWFDEAKTKYRFTKIDKSRLSPFR